MKFLTQALAVTLGVIGHAFVFMGATADNPLLTIACWASVVCLWAAAWLLWRRTMS